MVQNFDTKKNNFLVKAGFTIIEIMAVITIMAVLALGAFTAMRYVRQARIAATDSKLAKVDAMLEQYRIKMGEYPTDLQELIDGPLKPELRRKWAESYGSQSDLEDSWGASFVYVLNPRGARPPYELYSTGSTGDMQIFSPRSQEAT